MRTFCIMELIGFELNVLDCITLVRSYFMKALRAAATARSTSLTSLSGTVAQTLPVDGSKLSRCRPSAARQNLPSMKFSTWMRSTVAIAAGSATYRLWLAYDRQAYRPHASTIRQSTRPIDLALKRHIMTTRLPATI